MASHPNDGSGPSSSGVETKHKKPKKKLTPSSPSSSSQMKTKASLESSTSSMSTDDLLNNKTAKPKKKMNTKASVMSSEKPSEDSAGSLMKAGVVKKKRKISKQQSPTSNVLAPVPGPPMKPPIKKKTPPKKHAPVSQRVLLSPAPSNSRPGLQRRASASDLLGGRAISPANTSVSTNSSSSKTPPKKKSPKQSGGIPRNGAVARGIKQFNNSVANNSPASGGNIRKKQDLGSIRETGVSDSPRKKSASNGRLSPIPTGQTSNGRLSPKPTGRPRSTSPKSPQKKPLSKVPLQLSPKSSMTSPTKDKRPLFGRVQSDQNLASPTKATSTQDRPVGFAINTAGIVRPESPRSPRRGTRNGYASMRAASMMNLKSPTKKIQKAPLVPSSPIKKPTTGRRLPSRTKSSDLEELRLPQREPTSVRRSRSGDLELMAESSMHERTGIEAPPSILRNSTHNGRSILRNNSSHHGPGNARRNPAATRTRFHGEVTSDDGGDAPSIEEIVDLCFDDHSSIEEETIKFDDDPPKPRSTRPGLGPKGGRPGGAQARASKGLASMSGHFSMSTRSLMSTDTVVEFPDDKLWQKALRYIRILPPRPDEKLEKKRIRQYVWTTLTLDFIAAMVSITTYNGVTTCCGVPIFSLTFIQFDWSKAIRITTYIYLVMIFAEIIPVVRRGLPFNLLNPMVGFTITFAMFFDDRITEAICMWILEAAAICFEFLVYRIQRKLYHDRYDRLDAVQKDLTPYISRRKLMSSSHHRSGHNTSNGSGGALSSGSDDDSVSGRSFGDDDDIEDPVIATVQLPSSTNHKLREARLLRERRILRERQKAERTQLNYHLGGVAINLGLICISMILIIVIASSGGLCVRSDIRPVVFDMNQLDKCGDCRGQIVDGRCEICSDTMQCYYQYI